MIVTVSLSKNLKLRLLTSFFSRIINSAITPFLALFFIQYTDISTSGILLSIQIVLNYISTLIGGYIGDKYSESTFLRVLMYIHSLLLVILSISIYFKMNYIVIITLLFLSSIVGNMYKATFNSLLISETNKDNRRLVFFIDYLSANISLGIGLALGSLFFLKYQHILFLVSGVITLGIALVFQFYFQFKNTLSNHENIPIFGIWKNYSIPLKDRKFIFFIVGTSLITSTSLVLSNAFLINIKYHPLTFSNISIFKKRLDINYLNVFSFLQIENALVVILCTSIVFKLIRQYKSLSVIAVSSVVMTFCYSFILLIRSPLSMMLLVLVASVVEISFATESQAIQAEIIPLKMKSSYMAIGQVVSYIAQALAALGVTILNFGIGYTFLYTMLLGILGTVFLYLMYNKNW